MVRLDGVRDFAGHRNHPPCENAADRAAGDILQSPVAHSCGVSTLVKGYVGGIISGRHHLGVLVGDITHRCRTVGVCVCDLHLQTKEVEHVLLAGGAKSSLSDTGIRLSDTRASQALEKRKAALC
jgi:hypothetical protein